MQTGSTFSREAALAAFARHESGQEAESPGLLYSTLLGAAHRAG